MRDLAIGLVVWGAVVAALLSVSASSPPPQVRSSASGMRRLAQPDVAQELRMIHERAARTSLLY